MAHVDYMKLCIELAKKTETSIRGVLVGAMVVKDGEIVGRGYKRYVDSTGLVLHAERVALEEAGDRARGAVLYTTLEPCITVHHNPIFKACSDLILDSGVIMVYIGNKDITKDINGEGIKYLRRNGVLVSIVNESLEEDLAVLNKKRTNIFDNRIMRFISETHSREHQRLYKRKNVKRFI